jgi:serine/threonine protein kinase/Tol biopolymer transport system component
MVSGQMSATASLVGQTLGNYRVLKLIGVGGMGQVYRARDARLNRDVAIKVIHPAESANPNALPRFEQEARALAALNHPNLLAIYDIGVEGGSPYIVSELLEGETLRKRLTRERLSYRRALDFAQQIVRALVAAHEKGIVHRDLKPENIFLTDDGRVKVLDFGLAKLIEPERPAESSSDDTETLVRTEAGKIVGTVAYMSPEQLRGQNVDQRSDIFSFGTTLFEMLTQKRAFAGQTDADVMTAILTEETQNLSEMDRQIPPAASQVVQHCVEKRMEDRFQSARDLLFDLTLLSNNLHSTGSAIPVAESGRSRRRRAIWIATACIAVASIAILIWRLRPTQAQLPSYTQLTFRRGDISSARFTSDGNTVLYSASWNGAPVDIFSIRPGTTESRSLGLSNADLLAVSTNGEMAILLRKKGTAAWVNRGTLARAPLAGGAPREVVEDVQTADWSPDGSTLAIVRQVEDKQRLEFPIGKVLFETAGWLTDIRFSPRGDQIAFMEHGTRRDDRGWVSVVDLNGHGRRLTEEFGSERGLAWSPHGDEIWFTATRSGEASELFSVSPSHKVRLQVRVPTSLTVHDIAHDGTVLLSSSKESAPIIGLAPGETVERDLSSLDQIGLYGISDDGKTFLFQYYGEGSGPDYTSYLGRTDGSPPVRLGAGSAIALSPDGRWAITFDNNIRQTLLQPIGAGESRVLERTGFVDAGDDTWCPDSRHVVFTGQEAGKAARSYIQDIEHGRPVPFGPDGVTEPLVSPDGKRVLARKGENRVVFERDGGKLQEVRGVQTADRVIRWSGDSRRLYVYRAQGTIQLFAVDPDTGSRQMLREITLVDRAGVVSTPRLFVSADGNSYVYSIYRAFSELYLGKSIIH